MNKLFNESGGDATSRRFEADRLLSMVGDYIDLMDDREKNFLIGIETGPISPKQLFWLRDIKSKYAE